MTTVQISPEVQLQEMQAHVAMLQNRNLILAQALADARALGANHESRIAELIARIADLEAGAEPAKEVEEAA